MNVPLHRKNIHQRLTRREMDVMQALLRGYSNKEIARELVISERTVQTHLSNIFSKMDVNSRTEAVLVAMRDGWIAAQPVA
jgi:DNA-binding NarL/FixJ family response regulator